jgi:thiamine-monophosphate kinase
MLWGLKTEDSVTKTLHTIGERKAIELVREILDSRADLGQNDDCAVLEFGNHHLLLTTDVIIEGKHFPKGTDGKDIGWLVTAVNLSDIASMGGKPLGLVVSCALPRKTEASFFKGIARGMRDCAAEHGTEVVGGDTKEGPTLSLSGCALGFVQKDRTLFRRGARPGDVLAVTGKLGSAAAGYHSLKHGKARESRRHLRSLLRPNPLVEEGMLLSETGKVTSCIDLSDSLASCLHQLGDASGVGFEVELEKIPASRVVSKMNLERREAALYFGGDYQLLMTMKKRDFPTLEKKLGKMGTDLTLIGKATRKRDKVLITREGLESLENRSYEHF